MSGLANFFTQIQRNLLLESGFNDLYTFLTYLPYDLKEIRPLAGKSFSGEFSYLYQGKLVDKNFRKGKKPYFLLSFENQQKSIQAYYFSNAKYLAESLLVGQEYQLILNYKSPFWSVERFSSLREPMQNRNLILGRSVLQNYLIPKYQKLQKLTPQKFIELHRRLPDSIYELDFKGLIPIKSQLPQKLSLLEIHRPKSKASFFTCKQKFIEVQVFLKLALIRHLQMEKPQKPALATELNLDFLKQVVSTLPYQLSPSQKKTIWDILKDLSFNL